jgi:general secretion pathway protein D
MTIIPTITEFVGYDTSSFSVQAAGTGQSANLGASVPLPRVRTRQVTTSCVVWDGQTVVLGGLISENIQKVKDKVPVLGDLPLLGRMFRSESSAAAKKNLLIFVTPTIIDPAGNRLHSPEEMPFAQNSFPPQPSVTAQR